MSQELPLAEIKPMREYIKRPRINKVIVLLEKQDLTHLPVAERYYEDHKRRVSNYQKSTPDKQAEKCKKYMDNIRLNQPERYEAIKERTKKNYYEIVKPRNAAKKAAELAKLSEEINNLIQTSKILEV